MKTIGQIQFRFLQRAAVILLLGTSLTACGWVVDEDRIKIAQIGDEALTRGDLSSYILGFPSTRAIRPNRNKVNSECSNR